jgi:hypothetical protein
LKKLKVEKKKIQFAKINLKLGFYLAGQGYLTPLSCHLKSNIFGRKKFFHFSSTIEKNIF